MYIILLLLDVTEFMKLTAQNSMDQLLIVALQFDSLVQQFDSENIYLQFNAKYINHIYQTIFPSIHFI